MRVRRGGRALSSRHQTELQQELVPRNLEGKLHTHICGSNPENPSPAHSGPTRKDENAMIKSKPLTDATGKSSELDEDVPIPAPAISATKQRVNITLDADLLAHLKANNHNISARVNELLRKDLGL
jgi:uncharacterized protein (DUF4415 family)